MLITRLQNPSQTPFATPFGIQWGKSSFVKCELNIPFCAFISSFPISRVTKAAPLRTISVIVFHAFAERRSEGEIKFPAALFIIT